MKIGHIGEDVRELQHQLAAAGFNPGPVDGVFGPRTRRAVLQLQKYCGLAEDGSDGSLTQQALELLLPHRPQPARKLSSHFAETEFACRCCGLVRVNMRLVQMLEQLREHLGSRPVVITSGYRCEKHNYAVGGVKNSQHLLGNAADILVTGVVSEKVAAAADDISFSGLGGYSGFTHVDIRPGLPVRW